MAVNLADKYADKIQTVYVKESVVAGRLSNEYSFSGAKTVKVLTPQTIPMGAYKRTGTNRYGDPQEMQDTVQELTLTQDRSFSLTVDKGNNADQMNLKGAGKMARLQMAERAVPENDKYCLTVLANKAGTIVGNSTALSKSNIVDRISEGTQALDDAEIPGEGRTLFVPASVYKLLKHSDEFMAVESLGKKALAKGIVGEYDNMPVVKVPKGRWPENVNFIIAHRQAATNPVKIADLRLHKDPPGISGDLLEGRNYYDCFVFAPKCGGVYVEIDTGSGKGTVCAAPTLSAGTLSSTTGSAEISYTLDGSDPRYSPTAVVGTTVTGKGTLRAYAYKAGAFPSPVAELGEVDK